MKRPRHYYVACPAPNGTPAYWVGNRWDCKRVSLYTTYAHAWASVRDHFETTKHDLIEVLDERTDPLPEGVILTKRNQ